MCQQKIDKIFKELPNIFSIAVEILSVDYDANGKDYNRTLRWVMQMYQWENVKINVISDAWE